MMDNAEDSGSDSSDDDYMPSGGEGVSEEENSGDEEDLGLLAEDGGAADTVNDGKGKRKAKKHKQDAAVSRKRQGGIQLEGEEAGSGEKSVQENGDDYNKQLVESIQLEKVEKKEVEEKKKADSLWSDFMSDFGGPKAKPKPPATGGLGALCGSAKSSPKPSTTSTATKSTSSPSPVSTTTSSTSSSSTSTSAASKVTITQEFDFAGETVKITKEVAANSKEAMAQQESGEGDKSVQKPSAGPSLASLGIGGLKRPGGGIGSVLGKIGKKPKMSTLLKSKHDWDNWKKSEGIEEELQTHNRGKEGYIERQQFLERTDLRQFEIEKDMRNKTRKPFLS